VAQRSAVGVVDDLEREAAARQWTAESSITFEMALGSDFTTTLSFGTGSLPRLERFSRKSRL
jgi:hypothetical protein